MKKKWLFVGVFVAVLAFTQCSSEKTNNATENSSELSKAAYKNANLPINERVKDLLQRMTVEEKAAQTLGMWKKGGILDENYDFDEAKAAQVFKYGWGQIARPSEKNGIAPEKGRTAREMAEWTNKVQKFFIEKTRLGIPVLFHEEALHGHATLDGTSYPQPIALAGTWNTDLVKAIYEATAEEVRKRGAQQVLTPVVDVARDARWGRVEETFGEDPYLVAQMGLASVLGFQGENGYNGIDNKHVAATLKHFAAHGQPESGTNIAPANYDERTIREVFLYPFKVGVQQGKVLSLMASYNEISGVPSHASKWLLTDVLRKEWGFNGYVVSDYYGVVELHVRHSVAADSAEAAKMALEAGVEVELPDSACYNKIVSLVKTGRMKESVLDTAVARILRIKFLTGLFDNPYVSPDEAEKVTATPEKIALAKQAALESITLLKNSNNILPLNTKKLKTIAVVGPNADRTLLGGYAGLPRQKVSPLQGIKNAVGESVKVLYAEGCKITDVEKDYYGWFEDNIELPKPEDEAKRMAEAVSIAKQSDVIVFCIGQNEQISREAWAEAHMGDRSNLELIGNQNALFKALKATGKPIIVAIFNGSPVSFTHIAENADAILECWYLGQEGGNALADVLLGKYNPSGKLPISIPRSVGHIPAFYNYKPTARRGYIFDDITPLYPFGYGLSYTTFEYDSTSLQLSKKEIATNENVTVSINVKNTGNLAGKETVQLYIRDKVSSVTRPIKELKDFAQVKLEAGETKTVSFTITPEKLAFYDINMNFTVEAGEFELMLGSSSQDKDLKKITLKVK